MPATANPDKNQTFEQPIKSGGGGILKYGNDERRSISLKTAQFSSQNLISKIQKDNDDKNLKFQEQNGQLDGKNDNDRAFRTFQTTRFQPAPMTKYLSTPGNKNQSSLAPGDPSEGLT